MQRVFDMVERLRTFDTDAEINSAVTAKEPDLVEMNRKQLQAGKKADGESTGTYAPSTQKRKHRSRPVTLYETGKFHEGFFIQKTKDAVEFTAPPSELNRGFALRDHLKKVYGKTIFGLLDANFTRLQSLVKETMIKDLKAMI